MAGHPRQGGTHRAVAGAIAGQVSRRRVQFLAISSGQRLGSRIRRKGGELDQVVWQRPPGAHRHRQQDQVHPRHRAGHYRSGGIHVAWTTYHPDRYRSREGCPIRVGAGRYQCHHQGGDRRFPIIVRLAPEYRKSAEAIQNLRIGAAGPNGTITQIPLSEVASINLVSGAAYIYREQQERYLPIKFSVRERDLGGAVREAQEKVAAQIALPPGSHVEWVGEFGNLQDAIKRLSIVVPISLALIAVLLFLNFGSMVDTMLAMSVIPMAIFGGVLGLLITGIPFSVSAAIGFIALFGVAVMDGIIILSQYNQLIDEGFDRVRAVIRTGELQLRPVLMTCVIAGVGLLPAAMSAGIGSQVQKPLAVVVVTGMLLAPLVILVTLPVLIAFFARRAAPGR